MILSVSQDTGPDEVEKLEMKGEVLSLPVAWTALTVDCDGRL